jgi:hypothetical protein
VRKMKGMYRVTWMGLTSLAAWGGGLPGGERAEVGWSAILRNFLWWKILNCEFQFMRPNVPQNMW